MRCLVEDIDSIFHNKPVSYVWFCAYVAQRYCQFLGFCCLACKLFVCRICLLSSWKMQKTKKKKRKKYNKVNKNPDTNVHSHYFYFISLIDLNMCYFTWSHICLGNGISVLHNWIKPLFGEGPDICKSSRFRTCVLLFVKKMKKRKKWSKEGN